MSAPGVAPLWRGSWRSCWRGSSRARLTALLLAFFSAAAPAAAHAAPASVLGAASEIQALEAAHLSWQGQQAKVALPHVLTRDQFAPGGERVVYRLNLDLARMPREPWAIFIVKASRSAQVRVNGVDLGSCAPAPLEHLRCPQLPLFLTPPTSVWQPGLNQIEVEVFANAMQLNGLSQVLVGPAEALHEAHGQSALFWRHGLVLAVNWAIVTLGVMALLIGLLLPGPQRAMYLWFGLACMLRATSHLYATAAIVRDDATWIQWLFTAGRLASIPVMLLSLLSFFSHRQRWLERGLVAYALALPVLSALTGARTDIALWLAVPGVLVAIGLLPLLVRWAITERSTAHGLLAAAVLTILTCGFYDAWVLGTAHGFGRAISLPLANGALLATLGGILIAKMAKGLTLSETLNDTLRVKVAAAEADLRAQHATILTLERRHARVEEREQLLRDLHDGLGSNLASARILLEDQHLEPEQMRQLLDDCIDDMRLLLDSSGPQAQLADALGNLRYRLTQRLQSAPVQLDWSLSLGGLPELPDATRLQLLRLVQEALTNALRHSGARHIRVTAHHELPSGQLRLSVLDDGRGISDEALQGRGLENMRHRAGRIGATLELRSNAEGTLVQIVIPLT